jgi:hypothetical protein
MTVFVTDNPIEQKMLEMLIDKNSFSYKIKKVNLKEIVGSLRN